MGIQSIKKKVTTHPQNSSQCLIAGVYGLTQVWLCGYQMKRLGWNKDFNYLYFICNMFRVPYNIKHKIYFL